MKRLGKLSLIITLILLLLPFNNGSLYAAKEGFFEENTVILQSENEEEIEVFEDISSEIPITTVQNNTVATLISEIDDEEDVVKIRVIDELEEEVEGYVSREYITYPEELLEESNTNKEDQSNNSFFQIDIDENWDNETSKELGHEPKTEINTFSLLSDNVLINQAAVNQITLYGIAIKNPTKVYEDTEINENKVLKEYPFGATLKYRTYSDEWYQATVYINGIKHTGYIYKDDVDNFVNDKDKGKTSYSYGIKHPTNVYAAPSNKSKILKSYNYGHRLKYQSYSENWFQATVYISGEAHTGYISKADLGDRVPALEEGYAQLEPTNIYESTSKQSKVLKSYRAGHVLKYRPYNDSWNIVTVYINGEAKIGFLHKDDVGEKVPILYGYAQLEPTNVYTSKSKSSKVLKSYRAGHRLKYRPHDNSWYEATVLINGKWETGYINRNQVGDSIPVLQGFAQLEPTNVYASESKNGNVLKSYQAGHLLKYRPHNNTWYIATVYINGKAHTGYIHKDDVGKNKPTLNGYAQLEPTNVYQSRSKTSKVLKSYRAGYLLKYRPYNNSWYEATVYINGSPIKGYIQRNDVGDKVPTLTGIALKQPTSVYSKTSRTSSKLRNYQKGHILKYRPHNSTWYKATVYIDGKAHTGYIHRDDVITSNGKTVVIDAGHGGSDPGATGNNLLEKEINLDIAKRVQKLLEEAGFKVIMTRTTDKYLTLQERSSLANSANADLFVSIHTNSGGGHGVETWWYGKYEGEKSKELATHIQNEIIKETGTNNRGVKGSMNGKEGNFHVNRETKMPSALVEVGFIDNETDANKLKSSTYRSQVARGIVNGIKKFFQIFS